MYRENVLLDLRAQGFSRYPKSTTKTSNHVARSKLKEYMVNMRELAFEASLVVSSATRHKKPAKGLT